MARQEPTRVPGALAALAALAFLLAPASAEARFGDRTLKKGATGTDVKVLQKYLSKLGYRVSATGRYGTVTVRNVKRFEHDKKRLVNGRVERPEAGLIKRLAANSSAVRESNGGSAYGAPKPNSTGKAKLQSDGTAIAPVGAPDRVKKAITAANKIITKPYRYGGGHGSFEDSGYDCSGTVSYALHGAGLLKSPMASTGFMGWAQPGKGKWITTYAHSGHMYVIIAGLRLDTSGSGGKGPRWRGESRSPSGFTARHPRGL